VANYLDGPNGAHRYETYLDCYRNDPSIEATEAAATLASAIDYWFCGPNDDGDEGQEYILTRTVERAAVFIAGQPCTCAEDLCERCMAIGCGYGEHRTPSCLNGRPAGEVPLATRIVVAAELERLAEGLRTSCAMDDLIATAEAGARNGVRNELLARAAELRSEVPDHV
jgi:hypothetical protein